MSPPPAGLTSRKMKARLRSLALLLFTTITAVAAIDVTLTQDERQKCSGMYSKKSWGGKVEPFILVKFIKDTEKNHGIQDPVENRHYICNDESIKLNLCNDTNKGEWVLAPDAQNVSQMHIRTAAINLNDPKPINYPVANGEKKTSIKTGYYCVAVAAEDKRLQYTAIVTFRNAYGELQAAQIAKLPFYGGITIVYFVVLAFWGFLYFQNRHDILAVQNYITAILNRHGNNVGAKALMIVVAVLNAFRNSFSFFLLLIVCMGYGVVKPSLGKTMTVVRWLAVAHFVFGVIYAVASLTVRPDDAGPLVLLVILPLSATLTAFYIWTLNSLNLTMKDLMERKQHVKATMYKRLWWCILTSIIVIFGFFFINSFTFAGASTPDFAPTHWQTRWFVLDGWLNLVYLADVCFVAYMWRPTANNRRFAMSDEIAQDDEGFEIASLRDSLDEEERGAEQPPSYDPPAKLGILWTLSLSAPSRTPKYICDTCRTGLKSFSSPAIGIHQAFSSASSSNRQNIYQPTTHGYLRKRLNAQPSNNDYVCQIRRTRGYSTISTASTPATSGFALLPHRRLISLSGPDAAKFLQGLITNNVDPNSHTPFYSAFLDARGRVLWDVFIWVWPKLVAEKEHWACYIEVDENEVEALAKHLKRHKLRSKVQIEHVSEDQVRVWAAWGSLGNEQINTESLIAELQDPRARGFRRYLTGADTRTLIQGTEPLGVHEYQVERYRHGIAEGPADIARESALPMECNIDLWHGIDFKKGCYVGQELTIRTKHTGVVRKRILPIILRSSTMPPTSPEPGADIKEIDESGGLKKGRAAGKIIASVGDVGLALCRLENMTGLKVSGEGGSWKPGMRFGCETVGGEVGEVEPVLFEWFVERERGLWDKNGKRGENHFSISNIISRFRLKRRLTQSKPSGQAQQEPPQDTRPPLIPAPLPLILPEHQQTLLNLGWTTLTFPDSLPPPTHPLQSLPVEDHSAPGPHPLQTAYQDLFTASQAFFAQSDTLKAQWAHKLGTEEGWSKVAGEKEFITLRTLEYCPDILRAPAKRYWDLIGTHCSSTLGRMSTALGLPAGEDEGLRRFVGPCASMPQEEGAKTATMLRLFRYEGWEAKVVAEPHADLGLLSVVVGDVPGLEVWDGAAWFDVEREVDRAGRRGATMLVGRQLERLSNKRFKAGGHRVVAYGETKPGITVDLKPSEVGVPTEEALRDKRYRFSIVFVLRAHEPVVIRCEELETQVTGKWAQPMEGVTAGEFYEGIRKQHFNINIDVGERERQRRKLGATGKDGGEWGGNTIDLQDKTSPTAQDHSQQPHHPAPLGIGPAAPHQQAAIRHVEEERHTEEARLQDAWSEAGTTLREDPGSDDERTIVNHSNGQRGTNQDEQAVRLNGGISGDSDDADMQDADEEDMDDDMMDKISSSPSIDDGGYSLPSYPTFWPIRQESLTLGSSPLPVAPSSSPFANTPLHFPISATNARRPLSVPAYQTSPLPSNRPMSIPISSHFTSPQSTKSTEHHLGEYTWTRTTNGPDLNADVDIKVGVSPRTAHLKVVERRIEALREDSQESIFSELDEEHVRSVLKPICRTLLDIPVDPFLELPPKATCPEDDDEDGWTTDSDADSWDEDLDQDKDDASNDVSFSEDPRFVDSGWGGECLRETEDIDFEFVYALHTFVATVEGQANATKGDTMVLLDDSNSYWWLVRVVKDNSIGYLPAEHIETPTERLARLNKHRNIDLSATMLGDTAEKSKNPLKKAMRRRNAKTVQFGIDTYVEASDYNYSSDEEEEEGELFGGPEPKEQQVAVQPDEATQDLQVQPLKVGGGKKGANGQTEGDARSSSEDSSKREEDQQRGSEDAVDRPLDPKVSRNGTVRNTDSFFKDENTETRKITLTPNLLRDDSSTAPATSRERGASLESLEKNGFADKVKDDKRKKEKKGMLSGLFKRKDKKGKGAQDSIDGEIEKPEEADRSSPQSKPSEESVERPSAEQAPATAPAPARQSSKGKLHKNQRSRDDSPQKTKGILKTESPTEMTAESAVQPDDSQSTAQQTTSSVRLVSPEQGEATKPSLEEQVTVSSPTANATSSRNPFTNMMKPQQEGEVKREKVHKAKQRMQLDDFDSDESSDPFADPDAQSKPTETETSEKAGRLSESPVHVSAADAQPLQKENPTEREKESNSHHVPGLSTDSSSQETSSPISTPTPDDSPMKTIPEDSTVSKFYSENPSSTHTTINPPGPPPSGPAPMPSKDRELSPPTSSESTMLPAWSDASLRAYLDDGSEIRDMLVVINDTTGVLPVGSDHPWMKDYLAEETKTMQGLSGELDRLLNGLMEKSMKRAGSGASKTSTRSANGNLAAGRF
ncbi:integral membrane [Pyrenophora seminiperda CCB06]|uniref:Iron-sulfur cluster assembly factor IBA57 homolog, mitochondrial n=1 Tax=Pyrenophora seminiperda CCB06 TaxID=1302712 RepID=A0A3M7M9P3_9PLEO|nr:integral membrane [Pyrenophora seminiperda CCB06]